MGADRSGDGRNECYGSPQARFHVAGCKSNDLEGYAFQGRFASYDGSGFVYDLTNLTTDNLVDAFNYLEENTWLIGKRVHFSSR